MSFVGKYVNIVTKRGIRYEGILDSINQREQTIQVTTVVCFGTEDRECERQLPPHTQILSQVSLARQEIATLETLPDTHVLRVPTVAPVPKVETMDKTPAPVQQSAPSRSQKPRVRHDKEREDKQQRSRRPRKRRPQQKQSAPPAPVAFDASASFFDTLADNEPKETRASYHRQRQVDIETFGDIAKTHQSGAQQFQDRRQRRPRNRNSNSNRDGGSGASQGQRRGGSTANNGNNNAGGSAGASRGRRRRGRRGGRSTRTN